jgi:NAD(P)H-dependent FMN reductase
LKPISFAFLILLSLPLTVQCCNGEAVARWVYDIAKKRNSNDAEFEYIDIKDSNLPLLDESIPPSQGQYSKAHANAWSAEIDSFDAFIFVTPEYNHGIPGALKNAIDFLYREWNNKSACFVSYGSARGVRSVEHLRLVMANSRLQMYVHKSRYHSLQILRTLQRLNLLHFRNNT